MITLDKIVERLTAIEQELRVQRELIGYININRLEQGLDKLMQGQAALDNHREMDNAVLCERLDALLRDDRVKSFAALMQHAQIQEHKNLEAILTKLDALQARELIGDFKRKGRKSWRKSKKRK